MPVQLLFSLLRCLRRCLARLVNHCAWCGTQCLGLRTSYTGVLHPASRASLIRSCFRPFRTLCHQFLFLLCIGCLIQTGTCTRTTLATEAATAIGSSTLESSRMLALPTAGCQSVAKAGPAHLLLKRALRRVIGRAARNPAQSTHYKGRLCTLDTLRAAPANSGARPASRSRLGVTDGKQGPRLRTMSWNVGGLSQEADLQQKHVERITVVLVRHLRAIARSFAHMSQEASQALLLRLGVEDPLPFLLRAGQKLLTKTLQSQDPMVHQPRILQWLAHITETRLALDSHVEQVIPPRTEFCPTEKTALDEAVQESLRIASLPHPLVGTQPGALVSGRHGPRRAIFSCPTCCLCFPDLAALKKHHAKHHASTVTPPHPTANAAEIRQHSVDGMPVCKHCGKDYVTWFNLKRHIQHGHCTKRWQTALASQQPPASTLAEAPLRSCYPRYHGLLLPLWWLLLPLRPPSRVRRCRQQLALPAVLFSVS